ncbi:tryglysin family RiPP peptide [Bacillus cytotoxicus]|uniref:Uncharacterized protein n=1 Tax=Bacillus cytotoxicus TaxID=580165 RepID=A0AAX2CI69_9BACI|nr:Protein of unknown function [Bacillus cytotoxicus]SCN38790.1 Protein of unknown function [Bacillus cytotoxicus]
MKKEFEKPVTIRQNVWGKH